MTKETPLHHNSGKNNYATALTHQLSLGQRPALYYYPFIMRNIELKTANQCILMRSEDENLELYLNVGLAYDD